MEALSAVSWNSNQTSSAKGFKDSISAWRVGHRFFKNGLFVVLLTRPLLAFPGWAWHCVAPPKFFGGSLDVRAEKNHGFYLPSSVADVGNCGKNQPSPLADFLIRIAAARSFPREPDFSVSAAKLAEHAAVADDGDSPPWDVAAQLPGLVARRFPNHSRGEPGTLLRSGVFVFLSRHRSGADSRLDSE